jgi:hypothetical protein
MPAPLKLHPDPDRLVDEMAVALCGLLRIEDEATCVLALMEHGFRAAEITAHFDEALALARMARADGWHEPAPQPDLATLRLQAQDT